MPILALLKIGLPYLVGAGLLMAGWLHYQGLVDDREALHEAGETIEKLNAQKDAIVAAQARERALRRQTEGKLAASEAAAQKSTEVFEGRDFDMLFQRKPGLLVRMGNRATQRVFDRLEISANKHAAPVLGRAEASRASPEPDSME